MNEAKDFIRSFSTIHYSKKENAYLFDVDYTRFSRTDADFNKKWILYSNGTRIKTFRNPAKNSEWDNLEIVLTDSFKELFDKYGISSDESDMRESICLINDKQFFIELIELIKLMLQMRNSITGRTDVDYLISPVKNSSGLFYDSRLADETLPKDADANGAFNIARKVLWAIDQFKDVEESELSKVKISISNKEWLKYAQMKG